MSVWGDPSVIDEALDSRAVTFENPTGDRGAGGTAHGGRKGAPYRDIAPGETVELADLAGPGTVRHLWCTFPPAPPEVMRAQVVEVRYDGLDAPSIAAPLLDLVGLPHGRPVPFASLLATAQEGRGFHLYAPMPFRERFRMSWTNGSGVPVKLFYQLDYTLQPELPAGAGYLHATFRRENPTTPTRDFVAVDGLRGPGRLLGLVIGVRVLDEGWWWGEGEVKVYRDGDTDHPTICGTGFEDYVGSAWGMGAHNGPYAGAPLVSGMANRGPQPDFVGCYRWHLPDPIVFADELRVTVQQIGIVGFHAGEAATFARFQETHAAAGAGWSAPTERLAGMGIYERADDYCATALVYCREPQAVTPVDVAAATADLARLSYETPSAVEDNLA